ncbi:MAG: ferredoxin reductase [Candidatus Eremiobacteraeota bacterium]|nr:ferredoxin reductase [Candidatus Eremiobacteraeota bacterium]
MQPLEWQAAMVTAIRVETHDTKSFAFALPRWTEHQPGQHYDLRLTAPDGYRTERSYSIASPPERVGEIDLTVERIADGEVSPYLHDVVAVGDRLELRGPVGGYFVWNVALGGPLMLIAGGSGVVPLMAMLRHRAAHSSMIPTRLLYSCRTGDDVIYKDELDALAREDRTLEVALTFTRKAPVGWTGYQRRIDDAMLGEVVSPLGKGVRTYVCGPTLLVESAANALTRMGLSAPQIRTERFGPTGK